MTKQTEIVIFPNGMIENSLTNFKWVNGYSIYTSHDNCESNPMRLKDLYAIAQKEGKKLVKMESKKACIDYLKI